MKIVRTMTLTEFQHRLRKLGIGVSPESTIALIRHGLFDGVAYPLDGKTNSFLILEKKFEEWVEQYAEEVELSLEMVAFLQLNQDEIGEKGA